MNTEQQIDIYRIEWLELLKSYGLTEKIFKELREKYDFIGDFRNYRNYSELNTNQGD